jgi:hypothetical protein
MKLIGKNSVSKYLSYFFYFLFITFTLIGLYEIFGFSVILYNEKTGSHFFSQTFYISQDVGWSNNFYTEKLKNLMKFRINIPFTETQLYTGIYNSHSAFNIFSTFFYLSFFTFCLYKILKELTKEIIFSKEVILWLKRLAYLNLLYIPLHLFKNLIFKDFAFGDAIYTSFYMLIIGCSILFVIAFFKKGYELQSENDLTI